MDISQIQDVTDSLALMPDAALQKYAMMNKDDPYIMSLAMSENNRRQKLRTAQQGQAGQMPQPKVVDQAIQAINPPPQRPMMPQQTAPQQPPQGMPQAQRQLPEQQGIAQLPAPNMQGMADGGIAGYAPGFADGVIMMGGKPYVRNAFTGKMQEVQLDEKKPGLFDMVKKLSDYSNRNADNPDAMAPTALRPPAVLPVASALQTPNQQGSMPGGSLPPRVAPPAPPAPPPAAPPTPKVLAANPAPRTAAADAGISSLVTDPTALAKQLADIKSTQKPEVQPEIKTAMDEATAARVASSQAEEAQRQKDVEAMGTAFSDREAKLKAKQGRIEAQEKDLGPMALMQAGFAMMSGTSPYALANIGAGATIGMKSYQEGLDKIEGAKDKLDDAFGRIEEYRRNEQVLNAKDKRKAVREIGDITADAKKTYLAALTDDWGVKQKDAQTIFGGVVANQREKATQQFQAGQNALDRSSRERSAAISAQVQKEIAAMPGATERFYGTLGGGNTPSQVKKGFEYFTAATAEGKGTEAIIQAVMKTPEILSTVSPELRKIIETAVMERFTPGTVPGKAVPAAQVRAP